MRHLSTTILSMALALMAATYAESPTPLAAPVAGEQAESEEDARIGRMFDPGGVATYQGKIVEVGRSAASAAASMRLLVNIDGQPTTVQLGPEWVVQSQGAHLQKGGDVWILGSKVIINGAPWLIAAKVRQGENLVELRSDLGMPIWQDKSWSPPNKEVKGPGGVSDIPK